MKTVVCVPQMSMHSGILGVSKSLFGLRFLVRVSGTHSLGKGAGNPFTWI